MGQFMETVIPKISKIITVCKRPSLRMSIFFNIVAFGLLWLGYSAVRRLTSGSFQLAQENADRVVSFQERIGLPSEAVLQKQMRVDNFFLASKFFLELNNRKLQIV